MKRKISFNVDDDWLSLFLLKFDDIPLLVFMDTWKPIMTYI